MASGILDFLVVVSFCGSKVLYFDRWRERYENRGSTERLMEDDEASVTRIIYVMLHDVIPQVIIAVGTIRWLVFLFHVHHE